MKMYKYSDKRIREFSWILIIVFIMAYLFGYLEELLLDKNSLLLGLVASVIVFGVGIWVIQWTLKKGVIKSYTSIEIILDENSVTTKQKDTTLVTLDKSEIQDIHQLSKGLLLQSEDNDRYIFIPKGIGKENYQEVLNTFSTWQPIHDMVKRDFLIKQAKSLLYFFLYLAFFISTSIYIYLPSVLILIGMFVWENKSKDIIHPQNKKLNTYAIISTFVLLLLFKLILC